MTRINCVYLRCTTWCSDTHHEISNTIKPINILLPHIINIFPPFLVVIILKIHPLGKFKAYNTASLTISTSLYIRSPELVHLAKMQLYALWPAPPRFPPWFPLQPLAPTILHSTTISLTVLDFTCKGNPIVIVFLCLIYFT